MFGAYLFTSTESQTFSALRSKYCKGFKRKIYLLFHIFFIVKSCFKQRSMTDGELLKQVNIMKAL